MDKNLICISKDTLNYILDGKKTTFESKFLRNYKRKAQEIKLRNEWKNSGEGAGFLQGGLKMLNMMDGGQSLEGRIQGVCFDKEHEKAIYSAQIEQLSGIFETDGKDEIIKIQDMRTRFYNLDINKKSGDIAVGISRGSFEQNIAYIPFNTTDVLELTEGQTIDANPHWSCFEDRVIYYDSKGLGLNEFGAIVGYSNSTIMKLDISKGEVEEILADKKYDYINPKTDSQKKIYFIRKPKIDRDSNRISFLDTLLIPFKILKGVFKFLEFFTLKYSGESFNSKGNNPAKVKQEDPKEIFILGNLIKAEKELEKNRSAGEKYPGIAPRSWELMCLSADGKLSTIKKGVICYDISQSEDTIYYSNGSYILALSENKEVEVDKVELIEKLSIG